MRNYEIEMIETYRLVVGAFNEDEALEIASERMSMNREDYKVSENNYVYEIL